MRLNGAVRQMNDPLLVKSVCIECVSFDFVTFLLQLIIKKYYKRDTRI